jgi:sulfite reductase alpha subunit
MSMEGDKLVINNAECVRCMHCINTMPRALKPGLDTGVTLLCGAKAPILEGAQLATLLVPFMKAEPPYDNIKEVIEKIWEFWMENGKNRERVGELIQRVGLPKFLEAVELPPAPQHVKKPRENPYILWKEEDVPGGWKRDINVYRQRHKR